MNKNNILTLEQSIVQMSVKTIPVSNWNKIRNKIKKKIIDNLKPKIICLI